MKTPLQLFGRQESDRKSLADQRTGNGAMGTRTPDLLHAMRLGHFTTRTGAIQNRVFRAVFGVPIKRGFDVTMAYL